MPAAGRLLLAVLLLGCAAFARAEPLDDAALLRALRAGGLVLYLRHAATDFSQNDEGLTSYEDCATQRNLTGAGRAQARGIGEAIRKLGIPVDRVYASPFCRTLETAMLVFGKAEKTNDARGGPVKSDDSKRYDGLRTLLSTLPRTGANTVISSHGNPFYAVFGPPYLGEGEIAVIRPGGAREHEVIARIQPTDWARLAR